MPRKIKPLRKSRKRNDSIVDKISCLIEQSKADVRFLLRLKDSPVDGKWDYHTIREIDDIRGRAGA